MQKIVYKIIGTVIAFAVTQYFIAGFQIETTIPAYLITSLVFILISSVISPLLKLILFPINLLTLGLFHWVINILVLYIFDLVYQGLTISSYSVSGTEISFFWALVFSSFLMSLSYNIFKSIFRD
jgi:putative membrane protein